MNSYLVLPLTFLLFWFWEAPKNISAYFLSLNSSVMQFFSVPLLLRTYFKPWKNEYRQGLVGFSIGMGMFIKTWVILFGLLVTITFIIFEILFLLGFLLVPFITIRFLMLLL